MSYVHDRKKTDVLMPQVRTIMGGLPLAHFAEIHDAPVEVDIKHATDLTLRITGGDIAVRLRFQCLYRDLTIRASRDTGAKTELAKIKGGYAFRYFYGWVNKQNCIAEWILVDLDKMRGSGLLKKDKPLKDNGDGTHFIYFSVREVYDAGCLIAYCLKDRMWRRAA